jgi:hypothetical protein
MPKRSSKASDPNVTAFEIIQAATGQPAKEPAKPKPRKKNPAAVALGRLGGLKGGKARAAKLSVSERKEIAKKAARIRWAKTQKA